jgi:tagatose-6-phosphate ketose/aldose isomerase
MLAMSESALGLRHGPMAALDKTTLLVAFLSSDETVVRYERDLLYEVAKKQLVKTRIAVGGHSQMPLDGLAERYLSPDIRTAVPDDCRPSMELFGQLLGLFFCLRWNLRPDHPSPTGAISRVLENVKIYA